MLPRSDSDVYVCRTHKLDSTACSTPPISRAAVEEAALSLFQRVAFDVEATRESLATSRDERLSIVQAQVDRAAREIAELTGQLDRVERDYRADELGGAAYSRLLGTIEPELEAAKAEFARLTAQADDVRQAALTLDLDGEMLGRLTELRVAVAERVADAADTGDVGALRAAIGSVFSEVYIRPVDHPITTLDGYVSSAEPVGASFYLEPHLNPEMIAQFENGAGTGNVLKRVPLKLTINKTTSGVPE
jgi:hypothetical protein